MPGLDNRKILIATGAASAFAALVVFGYVPIAWQKYVLHKTLARQSLTIDQVRDCKDQLSAVQTRVAELRPIVQKVERGVPESRQFASLWQEIADLMSQHNLRDQQVKPGEELDEGDVHSVSLEIQCVGNLSDVFAFVGSLENMERLVRIEQMDLTNDKDLSGMLTLSAKAKVFYRTANPEKPS